MFYQYWQRVLQASICALVAVAVSAVAEVESTKVFGAYTVHYSTFNSLFVPEDIARVHQLVRAKDQTLINISVHQTETGHSVAAKVEATARNLIQQVRNVSFKTISEPDAVYYIGALRHRNEEVFHLDFTILPEGADKPLQFRVTRKLYTEP